jgi:hypothetical protein
MVHYCVHNNPLKMMNTIKTISQKQHFNIILSSTSRSFKGPHFITFFYPNCMHLCTLPCVLPSSTIFLLNFYEYLTSTHHEASLCIVLAPPVASIRVLSSLLPDLSRKQQQSKPKARLKIESCERQWPRSLMIMPSSLTVRATST